MTPVYEDAIEAIQRGFNNPKRKPKSVVKMEWVPPEGSCELCGSKDVSKGALCMPCWRLDAHRRHGA